MTNPNPHGANGEPAFAPPGSLAEMAQTILANDTYRIVGAMKKYGPGWYLHVSTNARTRLVLAQLIEETILTRGVLERLAGEKPRRLVKPGG